MSIVHIHTHVYMYIRKLSVTIVYVMITLTVVVGSQARLMKDNECVGIGTVLDGDMLYGTVLDGDLSREHL